MSDRKRSPVTARSKEATLSMLGEMSMPIHSWERDFACVCASFPPVCATSTSAFAFVFAPLASESDMSASDSASDSASGPV